MLGIEEDAFFQKWKQDTVSVSPATFPGTQSWEKCLHIENCNIMGF